MHDADPDLTDLDKNVADYVSESHCQNKNKFYEVFVHNLLLALDNRADLILGSMHITLLYNTCTRKQDNSTTEVRGGA